MMINPILKMEVDEFLADISNTEKFPNLYIFLEKMQKNMETAQKLGL